MKQVPIQVLKKYIKRKRFQSSLSNAISLNKMIHKINPMERRISNQRK